MEVFPCTGGLSPCIVCGKPVVDPKFMIHVHAGGTSAVTEEEAAQLGGQADLGLHPLGGECRRKHPALAPYVQRGPTSRSDP
jgi:hypothetical protein